MEILVNLLNLLYFNKDRKDDEIIFMCNYQLDRDKQGDTQAFFANITQEQIGRWHDMQNGRGWIEVVSDNQEALNS